MSSISRNIIALGTIQLGSIAGLIKTLFDSDLTIARAIGNISFEGGLLHYFNNAVTRGTTAQQVLPTTSTPQTKNYNKNILTLVICTVAASISYTIDALLKEDASPVAILSLGMMLIYCIENTAEKTNHMLHSRNAT